MSGATDEVEANDLKKMTQLAPWFLPMTLVCCLVASFVGWTVEDLGYFIEYSWESSNGWLLMSLGSSGAAIGILTVWVFCLPLSVSSWRNRIFATTIAFASVVLSYKLGLGTLRAGLHWWRIIDDRVGMSLLVYFVCVVIASFVLNSALFTLKLYRGNRSKWQMHRWIDRKYRKSRLQWLVGLVVISLLWGVVRINGNQDYASVNQSVVFGAVTAVGLHGLFLLSALMPNRWLGFVAILIIPT